MTTQLQYGHWGITVFDKEPGAYAPSKIHATYYYPVGCRGPVDSADTERKAVDHCRRLGGVVKGPFFYKE
jgi:hypothetical protein